MQVGTLILLPFCLLGLWKVHDLLLPKSKSGQDIFNAATMMSKFIAEFTHKTMKGLDTYEDAPPEIYKWLQLSFKEWYDARWKK